MCASTDRALRNKNSEQSAYNQVRSGKIFFCLSDSFVMLSLKEISDFLIAQSFSLRWLLHSVYGTAGQTQCANYRSLLKTLSVFTPWKDY